MTDLPAAEREQLVAGLLPELMTPLRTLEADKGTTRKTLWRLFDGALVESVLMRYPDRVTMCVSSQAGCGMACPFCATGQGGLQRNMSTAEIVEQVVAGARSLARDEVPGGPGRVNNVVFMGMGEPMANYKAVIGAVRRMTDKAPDGLGMSARGITVSTVGLVPRMRQLAEEGIPVTLALSLHAPDDELRNELVPINTRWTVHEAVDAAWNYAHKTKRRVSIEYAMMRDINDQAWRADLLGDVLTSYGDWGWVHVNLIPLNPTPGLEVDGVAARGRARVRPPARGQGRADHGARHARQRDRRRVRPARRARRLSPVAAGYYDREATRYDESRGGVERARRAAEAVAALVPAPGRTLDVAGGTGIVSAELAAQGRDVLVVDLSVGMLRSPRSDCRAGRSSAAPTGSPSRVPRSTWSPRSGSCTCSLSRRPTRSSPRRRGC